MFTRKENGAEVEITVVDKPVNGAREDADGVYRLENGAEVEVWANTKLMDLYSKNYGVTDLTSQSEWGEDSYIKMDASSSDDRTIIFSAPKATSKPTTVSFNLYASNWYANNDQELGYARVIAYKANKAVEYDYTYYYLYANASTPYNHTFTSECDEIRITLSGHYLDCGGTTEIGISDVLIDGQKYITDPRDDF